MSDIITAILQGQEDEQSVQDIVDGLRGIIPPVNSDGMTLLHASAARGFDRAVDSLVKSCNILKENAPPCRCVIEAFEARSQQHPSIRVIVLRSSLMDSS